MYENILVCTDGSAHAESALRHALYLARSLRARLHLLHVTDIRLLEGPLLADIAGAFGAQPYTALLPRLRQIQTAKANTILEAARVACEREGVPCTVVHETGVLTAVVRDYERHADLVVLGRLGEHAAWAAETLGSSVERIVRASIKPCLVVPAEFRPWQRLLLAFDGSAESRKALQAGLTLASLLQLPVTLVTIAATGSEEVASRILQEAQEQAQRRQVAAQARLGHGIAETEILRLATEEHCDLIVMGAYGHTRIRELILGSTTSHVLRRATVPVLLVRG